ncbi:MAG: hypothetical protein M3Z02_13160 [Actinomycetota bacterium]|nr:hypothetical protein [Actinomycetota bacterium]
MSEQSDHPTEDSGSDLPVFDVEDDAASAQLSELVAAVRVAVSDGELTRDEALVNLADGLRSVAADYPDVLGIRVRDELLRELDPAFVQAGFAKIDPYEF